MKDDIIVQAMAFLETKPLVIFALAYNYAGQRPTRKFVSDLLTNYRQFGKFDRVVQDFCIDLLARRIEVCIQTGKWSKV